MSALDHPWSPLLWQEAARALWRHRLRSGLTVLGIMFGVAALVWVAAIGKAATERWEEALRDLGDNLVWVEAGSRAVNGVRTGNLAVSTLTGADAQAILAAVPAIKAVSPQVDGDVRILAGQKNWMTRYRGVGPDFIPIRRWRVARGAAFGDEAVLEASNVCLLGETVRQQLFGEADPVGQEVRLGKAVFTVIGLLAPKGPATNGRDQDDTILVPYTTAQKKLIGGGSEAVDDIMCSAATAGAIRPATAAIAALLRERHQLRLDAEDDFNIRRPEEAINAKLEASHTLELLLLCLAGISLLVGGIGIMNVMLVSVTERTKEIGLRLAVGAPQRTVRLQFLAEAVVLSVVGGLLGVVLGLAGCAGLGALLEQRLVVSPPSLAGAPLVAAAVGIFFGWLPAQRAAGLDPIEALRKE
jgi:putative ABC transport system permease protein